MQGWADLHIHSDCSDSDHTLAEVFIQAQSRDLRCISVTDHDTTAHLPQARKLASDYGIELIDGVEISAHHNDTEVHILGYGFDPGCSELQDSLLQISHCRRQRLETIIAKLNAMGFPLDTSDFFRFVADAVPTRLHLALYMVRHNCVQSVREAFSNFLGTAKPAYVARFRYSVKEVIQIIKASGGRAFLVA